MKVCVNAWRHACVYVCVCTYMYICGMHAWSYVDRACIRRCFFWRRAWRWGCRGLGTHKGSDRCFQRCAVNRFKSGAQNPLIEAATTPVCGADLVHSQRYLLEEVGRWSGVRSCGGGMFSVVHMESGFVASLQCLASLVCQDKGADVAQWRAQVSYHHGQHVGGDDALHRRLS